MCGIAGLVTNALNENKADLDWLFTLSAAVQEAASGEQAVPVLKESIEQLSQRFDDLMSFYAYVEIAESISARQSAVKLADAFERHHQALLTLSSQGRTDLDPVIEGLRDYSWQIKEEFVAKVDHIGAIFPLERPTRRQRFVAWGIEQVLQALDRLEVRGRDSAGIAVQLSLDEASLKDGGLIAELGSRQTDSAAGDRAVFVLRPTPSNGLVASFVFKTASLIGRLGDNCAALRQAIRGDALLWRAADACFQLSMLSHTRWASNGIISIPNCHPVNASVAGDDPAEQDLGTMFVLNGDVDNYSQLVASVVAGRQLAIDRTITTDAKIIPIVHRWTDPGRSELTRFRSAMRQLEGSMAIVMIDPHRPAEVLLSQKGSGQGLYASRLSEGWLFASEIYGLASMSRHSYNLSPAVVGGSVSRLAGDSDGIEVRAVGNGEEIRLSRDLIQIFSRDIYRGSYEYFLQKEIYDAPSSVEKTLRGRYVKRADGIVDFDNLPVELWNALRKRAGQAVARIIVIGQGTAGVAAVGIAHLVERALSTNGHRKILVQAIRSSELSASIDRENLNDAIVVAVSQSGTTTDTNRAVDLARDRGAFVHAIVNRRNSDLVRKSDSVILTSDGRDVEMSVASTKAFYSQIAAGKLTALCLADVMNAMDELEIAHEIAELETLPARIREVLSLEPEIADCARALAPSSRYWAVTGSGVNHIAALEIRIKLSELCYKSIPVDFTEDKKHIDLSTEPLTLVIANDLSPQNTGDVVKEVAIFRAHSGKPFVFATQGPEANAFRPYAERVLALPRIGVGLSFVMATAAGHLWGFHAARAIDAGALRVKAVLGTATEVAEHGGSDAARKLAGEIGELVEAAAEGCFDSGLSANHVATLALASQRLNRLVAEPGSADMDAEVRVFIPMLKRVFEELSRPVDTIRHQAKTVTVGTTRPDDAVSLVVRDALVTIKVSEARLHTRDRRRLSAISKLTDAVAWAATYQVVHLVSGAIQVVIDRVSPDNAPSTGYAAKAEEPIGLFRRCLRDMKAVVGTVDVDACVMFPIVEEDTGLPEALCCLALKMAPYATKDQKDAVLAEFDLYNDMLYRFEEKHGKIGATLLAEAIAKSSPEQVLFEHIVALSDTGVRYVA
jgi:glucosamine--fructose-6-phosphate aminotransferase (isomerizing)